jgi:integrase
LELKLTKRSVAGIEPPPKGYELHWDTELHGFGLRITAGGARSFVVQKRIRGRTRRRTLGRASDAVTPELARREAQKFLGKVAAGQDPIAEREREKLATTTLEEAFTDYMELKRRSKDGKSLKERTKKDMREALDRDFDDWKRKPLQTISRPMVEQRYKRLTETSVARANIAMRYLRAVFNFTAERKVDSEGKPLLTDNPVRVLRQQWRAVKRRKRVMDAQALKKWVPAVRALAEAPEREPGTGKEFPKLRHGEEARDELLFIALTGCRAEEPALLHRSDVDLKGKEFTFRDTKNRSDHTLPMTPLLQEILTRRVQATDSGPIFPMTNFRYAVARVREQSGVYFTRDDLRRLALTAMERAKIGRYTIKAIANHISGDDGSEDVTQGYVQVDREMKLEALRAIEAHVLGVLIS